MPSSTLSRFFNSFFKTKESTTCTVRETPSEHAPTQADKASPSSSFGKRDLHLKLAKEWKRPDYKVFAVANTNSMEPLIDANSIIVAETLKDSMQLQLGDVCIYQSDPAVWGSSKKVLHQVKKRRVVNGREEFVFRGINNFFDDKGWVKREDIIARVVLIAYAKKHPSD